MRKLIAAVLLVVVLRAMFIGYTQTDLQHDAARIEERDTVSGNSSSNASSAQESFLPPAKDCILFVKQFTDETASYVKEGRFVVAKIQNNSGTRNVGKIVVEITLDNKVIAHEDVAYNYYLKPGEMIDFAAGPLDIHPSDVSRLRGRIISALYEM
ncbi:MAG: hypothetical protein R2688_04155 [Fimbriimonadaceae bacterium]